jgi:hypothetical protein
MRLEKVEYATKARTTVAFGLLSRYLVVLLAAAMSRGLSGVCKDSTNRTRTNRVRVRTSFIKENTQ